MSKSQQKIIKFKNSQLDFIKVFLSGLSLEGQESFARRRFLRDIQIPFSELKDEEEELKKKYCEKKPEGDPKILENNYIFSIENKKKLLKEWETLYQMEVIIDIMPSNEKDITSVKKIFLSEIKKFEESKSNKYTANDFDYLELMKEVVECLKISK